MDGVDCTPSAEATSCSSHSEARPFRTSNIVLQMLMAKEWGAIRPCLSSILPPKLWGDKSFLRLSICQDELSVTSTGPFGLLRDLSPDSLTFSVPLFKSMLCRVDNRRQYSVLGFRESRTQVPILSLSREKWFDLSGPQSPLYSGKLGCLVGDKIKWEVRWPWSIRKGGSTSFTIKEA